ncbi:octanoate-(acyl-carrier-protein)-protein-N-octan oyltransferase [Stappia sp. 22II-S9-Z10]|nr:octanoate-(acyl-carrier-protein)-protein-N-octan oyltransferase [Stappia sp. 22II-S9-Z10]
MNPPVADIRRMPSTAPTAWMISDQRVDYATALTAMEARATAIADGSAGEAVWLLEHPPLYTAGTSARREDLVDPDRFPVFDAGRGGQYTYHGPGQRVGYAMMDLRERGRDVRAFVAELEGWIIDTLAAFNVRGEIRDGRVGVWVVRPDGSGEDKIAALGLRVRRWVTFHGISLNVEPDLTHFDGIVPCGIRGHGVTSLAALGRIVSMEEVDMVLRETFEARFGPTDATPPLVAEAPAEPA